MLEVMTYILPHTKGNNFDIVQLNLAMLQIPVTAEIGLCKSQIKFCSMLLEDMGKNELHLITNQNTGLAVSPT